MTDAMDYDDEPTGRTLVELRPSADTTCATRSRACAGARSTIPAKADVWIGAQAITTAGEIDVSYTGSLVAE